MDEAVDTLLKELEKKVARGGKAKE